MMRWLLAWAFYWLGDAVWRSGLDRWEWGAERYQSVMRRAYYIQGEGIGPWVRRGSEQGGEYKL